MVAVLEKFIQQNEQLEDQSLRRKHGDLENDLAFGGSQDMNG
jgi:hypothetical protein